MADPRLTPILKIPGSCQELKEAKTTVSKTIRRVLSVFMIGFVMAGFSGQVHSDDWRQFRGSRGGVAVGDQKLPVEIGPDSAVAWKRTIAKGHSSPVIQGDLIYLTAKDDKELVTLALDRSSGKTRWRAVAEYDKLESIHRIGSHATPSVATDGTRVVSFFGSSGLYCYDMNGQVLWSHRQGPFNNSFGACSSPLIVDELVISVQDHDTGSYLAAFDKQTGELAWKTDRAEFRRNYSTPAVWNVGDAKQLVVAGTALINGYDVATGKLIWTVRGVTRVVSTTPVVSQDGRLIVACTGGGTTRQPKFDEVIAKSDANGDMLLSPKELPSSPIKSFFSQFDRDANGQMDRAEYDSIRETFEMARGVALSIRPGGTGDITKSHVDWEHEKSIPRNSSPLVYQGVVYLVADGGILTTLDAESGQVLKQGRLADRGKYYSSPVAGDGKVYVVSERGTVNVIQAKGDWELMHSAKLGEDCLSSPAIVNGQLFVRTVGTLYCFGQP